jgi:hypothetical protein
MFLNVHLFHSLKEKHLKPYANSFSPGKNYSTTLVATCTAGCKTLKLARRVSFKELTTNDNHQDQ